MLVASGGSGAALRTALLLRQGSVNPILVALSQSEVKPGSVRLNWQTRSQPVWHCEQVR